MSEDQAQTEITVTFRTPSEMHTKFRGLLDEYNKKNLIEKRSATSIFLVAMRDAISTMELGKSLPN